MDYLSDSMEINFPIKMAATSLMKESRIKRGYRHGITHAIKIQLYPHTYDNLRCSDLLREVILLTDRRGF